MNSTLVATLVGGGFALFGALALVRLVPKPKVVGGIAVVITLALLALWAHLASVTPASL